ncbi:hypothetical protein AML91_01660 [Paenibacillus jilunlii]|uniref:Uncharacterized protein n=1 Tax=Paenibacillus jilunlii TaxID=682956 RepID=A0ABR5T1L7_9BACL|nr:hypothetical protein AML91_01660 [Paenibacillus jilunlii]
MVNGGIGLTYKEVYDLHEQLLLIYEKNRKSPSPYQREINHYKRQFYIAQDIVQRIYVMNQLIILHEKSRGEQIKWCPKEYFN